MINFRDLSITRKLIVIQLVTTFAVVLSYGIFVGYNDLRLFRKTLINGLVSMAEVIGANSASALNFLDEKAAEENLQAVETTKNLVNAWIYDARGNLFAKYSKKGYEDFDFPNIKGEEHQFKDGFITVSKEIRGNDGVVGMVSLRLDTGQFRKIFKNNLFMLVAALIIGMAGAFLLSNFTHKTVSDPILRLAETVKRISYSGDSSVRMQKTSEDETGALYDGFNTLMEQTQVRERERDRAYKSLQESEQKYRSLFDNMNDGFAYHQLIVGADNRPVDYVFLEVNGAFERYTGLKKENIIGKKASEVIPDIRKTAPDLVKIYGQVAQDGKETHFELFFDPFQKWYAVSAYSPKPGYFCALFKDITEAKKSAELARVQQQQLIQADKMASLGLLVSGVAHEINNPNNFIQLNSENLTAIWKDAVVVMDKFRETAGDFKLAGLPYQEVREEAGPLIRGISDGAERIKKIVQNLKDFARQDPGDMNQSIEINRLLESSFLILNNLIRKSTDRFKVEYGKGLPEIRGNNQQIEQVIINLVSNACQALEDKGRAVVVTSGCDSAEKRVFVRIQDEGRGIPAEDLKRITDPFFTTRRDAGGTGLGLSISYNIIKAHGGTLEISSTPGRGTTTVINLPAWKA